MIQMNIFNCMSFISKILILNKRKLNIIGHELHILATNSNEKLYTLIFWKFNFVFSRTLEVMTINVIMSQRITT
jgi:hypothetical protein